VTIVTSLFSPHRLRHSRQPRQSSGDLFSLEVVGIELGGGDAGVSQEAAQGHEVAGRA
jgi:hypothetical protein